MRTKPTILAALNNRKIGGRKCLHGVPDYDYGCGSDQCGDPLHELTNLEHLLGLLAWVPNPGIVT